MIAAAYNNVLPSVRKTSVMVVDDQSIHRAILEQIIGGLAGQPLVEGFASGADALAWAGSHLVDLVLVDFMMPEMNGIELVRRLRALPEYGQVPIVMVTVKDDRDVRYAALDAGVSDFLLKPLDARECRARCRNLITLRRQQLALDDVGRREKSRAEQGMREREAELRLITEHVPAAVSCWDPHLRCLYANAAFLELFEVEAAYAKNAHISEIVGAAAWKSLDKHFAQVLRGHTVTYDRWLERASGARRHVTVRVVPHRNTAGRVVACYALSIDTTIEKRYREDLERQVTERTALLEAANIELARFSSTVSHDLRAPLRHVAGSLGMLGELAVIRADGAARSLVARTQAAVESLGTMVERLLRFANLGGQQLRLETVDVQALAAELREELSAGLASRRVEWRIGALPAVRADPMLLRLVLQNLLDNALKYTGRQAVALIELSATVEARAVTLCVRDNGAGFDMKDAERLFDNFARMHGEDEFPGTGIGLAHVKRIVERHGGSVRAEAAPDRGAAFFVTLPR